MFGLLALLKKWWAGLWAPKLKEPQGSPVGCPVEGCRIRVPHSHAEALIRQMQDKTPRGRFKPYAVRGKKR